MYGGTCEAAVTIPEPRSSQEKVGSDYEICFILWHLGPGADNNKLIGVYASKADVRAAINRVKNATGFVSSPKGFQFEEYEIGKDHWTEGFVVVSD